MAKTRPTNPLIAKAKALPKARSKCGKRAWYHDLKDQRPAAWRKLWNFMEEWTTDKSPDGIRKGIPDCSELKKFFKKEPDARGFAPYLPDSPVAFRKFCREFQEIKCLS